MRIVREFTTPFLLLATRNPKVNEKHFRTSIRLHPTNVVQAKCVIVIGTKPKDYAQHSSVSKTLILPTHVIAVGAKIAIRPSVLKGSLLMKL